MANAEIPTGFVRFQVNGKIYDLSVDNLKKNESTLANLILEKDVLNQKEPIVIDEDSAIFEAILNYHRTGLIAKPPNIADEIWNNRVKFWAFGNIAANKSNNAKYYMIDYLLYFGQKFIEQYNQQERTITVNQNGNKYTYNVSNMIYDNYRHPFYYHKQNESVSMICGTGCFSIRIIEFNDKFKYEFLRQSYENIFKYTSQSYVREYNDSFMQKLKSLIDGYLLKDCKRNKQIEDAFWKNI